MHYLIERIHSQRVNTIMGTVLQVGRWNLKEVKICYTSNVWWSRCQTKSELLLSGARLLAPP